jgi:anti-sigma B factor antagonist
MEFRGHDTFPGVLILVADDKLDSYDSGGLVDDLQRAIDGGSHTVVVDCARLGHVSTIAITTLVRMHKRLADHASELRLAAVQPHLRRVLGITRLDQVFRIFGSVDEAAQAPPDRAATAGRRRFP